MLIDGLSVKIDYIGILYLLVSVYDIARVEVFSCFEELIHDIALVYIFQNASSFYNIMQISFCDTCKHKKYMFNSQHQHSYYDKIYFYSIHS